MKVVIDTNVLYAALYSSLGAPHQLLLRWVEAKIDACASTAFWLEYEEVLKRSETRRKLGLTLDDVDAVLNQLAANTKAVTLNYLWRPQLQDATDEMILEAAASASADAIVTHNVADFVPGTSRFSLRVITPAKFLRTVRDQ